MPRRFDEDRRNKYARSAQAWLALVAHATQRRTTTYDALGALLLSHPLTLRSDLDPIDDYCNQHGLPPLAVVCVDPKTGEPSRGNVGIFRLDKNRERVFNHDWFALVPPTPEDIREAHLAQNPRPVHQHQGKGARNNSPNARPGLTSLGNHPGAHPVQGSRLHPPLDRRLRDPALGARP